MIFTIPTIFAAINIGIDTGHPISYPTTELALTLTNADGSLDNTITILEKNPEQFLEPKVEGSFLSNKGYYWSYIKLIWLLIGKIFLISIPFTLLYRYQRYKGQKGIQSSKAQDLKSALAIGLIFIFIMNLIFLSISQATGLALLTFDEGTSLAKQVSIITLRTIPFHGVLHLILYLAGIKIFF